MIGFYLNELPNQGMAGKFNDVLKQCKSRWQEVQNGALRLGLGGNGAFHVSAAHRRWPGCQRFPQ